MQATLLRATLMLDMCDNNDVIMRFRQNRLNPTIESLAIHQKHFLTCLLLKSVEMNVF